MESPLPLDLLKRSPQEGCRLVVLHLLDAAARAAVRLEDPEDGEALHDFRVALRRTRSAMRAWKPELEKSVRRRHRRALREIQRATGGGRDAQVALEWLAGQRAELRPVHRLGYDWLVARLERRQQEALAHARTGVREAFEELAETLLPRLERVTLERHLRGGARTATFGETLAERTRASAAELADLIARIGGVEDAQGCHRARVAGKRLRYLVEPVRDHAPAARSVVNRCKRLQDQLGDLNDATVQRDELGAAVETAAAERARHLHTLTRGSDEATLRREKRRSERSGLLELTRRAQLRVETLYHQFEQEWLDGGVLALLEDVEELTLQLEQAARPATRILRRYLLFGPVDLSPLASRMQVLEIRQGWLPGERLRERLRVTESASGTRYARRVALGSGIDSIEIDEPTTQRVFEALWPLTEGCRILKRRRRVHPSGEDTRESARSPVSGVWEIDEFLDRDLWLAQVEVGDAGEEPELPDWLAPHVERDVSDDPRFLELKLAR